MFAFQPKTKKPKTKKKTKKLQIGLLTGCNATTCRSSWSDSCSCIAAASYKEKAYHTSIVFFIGNIVHMSDEDSEHRIIVLSGRSVEFHTSLHSLWAVSGTIQDLFGVISVNGPPSLYNFPADTCDTHISASSMVILHNNCIYLFDFCLQTQ